MLYHMYYIVCNISYMYIVLYMLYHMYYLV